MYRRSARLASALFLSFAAAVLAGPLMLRTYTAIPLPAPDQKTDLAKLSYKPRRFEASVTSVTIRMKSPEGADPVLADWVFTGLNTDGQLHRVDVQVSLVDEGGKRVGWFSAKHPLSAAAKDETFIVPMKVKAANWSAAKTVRIVADWIN